MDELNQAFLEGYNTIIEALFKEKHESFIKIAYKILEDKDDAIDAVGDFYLKLVHVAENESYKFPRFYQEFLRYIHGMLKNICISAIKQKKRRNKLLINHILMTNQKNQSSEQDFIEPQLNNIINETLKPQELKILGFHLEGYKNDEIASELDLSYNTVKNNISVSKKKLKEKYKEYFQ